jgi:hypothetical protein
MMDTQDLVPAFTTSTLVVAAIVGARVALERESHPGCLALWRERAFTIVV